MRITVLGCGTSMGVPQLGCRCAVCTSDDPRNHRTRPSVHIQHGKTQILIDAPPELRLQLWRTGLDQHLDAVLITHTHADHIMGLDDIRGFTIYTGRAVPVYAEPAHWTTSSACFGTSFSRTRLASAPHRLSFANSRARCRLAN